MNNISDKASKTAYQFGGKSLGELYAIAGEKPVYVYAYATVAARIKSIREHFPSSLHLHYSVKANPHPQLLTRIASTVDGMDVASIKEMQLALATGLAPSTLSFSGPGKTDTELRAAIVAGIRIHIESFNEIEKVAAISKQTGATPQLSIRVNPDFSVRRAGMAMGGGPQPFGIDVEDVHSALEHMHNSRLVCSGLHCYAGSQILDAQTASTIQQRTLTMMFDIVSASSMRNPLINIGGGFGIPYTSNDSTLDIKQVGSSLHSSMQSMHSQTDNCNVALELGRYLVGEAGLFVCKVLDKKISRGKTYLVVDGGLHHHLAATGNLGQIIRRNYPIVCSQADRKKETVDIVGPLCTPLDTLARDIELPKMQIGDYVGIKQSGAYGYSASPKDFLSHPPPVELLL